MKPTARPPTEVCITVDTEFDIAGAFIDPGRNKPQGVERVWLAGEDGEQGLGFILATLNDYQAKATFFVEALQHAYFGDAAMGRVVEKLLAESWDVQLHLHPCWQTFTNPKWAAEVLLAPPQDSLSSLSFEEIVRIISVGLQIFQGWGVPKPIALRTGNLDAHRNIYLAMAEHGLQLASNIGAGYAPADDSSLHILGGRQRIGSVLEVPVTSYFQLPFLGRHQLRLLTITATSCWEMELLLKGARQAGVETLVVLTHPFEFAKINAGGKVAANRVNQQRLKHLCRFVADNPDEFVFQDFATAHKQWLQAGDVEMPNLRSPILPVVTRMVENKLNDTLWWY